MDNNYQENFQAIQSHLNIIQSVIQRMSTNSASCKAWCITLVSAILVIVTDKSKPEYALISIIPIILFLILDTYYLSLEKQFRNTYNEFVKKYHSSSLKAQDFFVVTPEGNSKKYFLESLISISVWPFYIMLMVMVIIAMNLVI